MDKKPGGLQFLGWQTQTDWAQNRVLNAGMHAHTHADPHTCMHALDLPAPGPREEAASWQHLDFVHIWKRHISLSWNMSLRSKCLIWQASGRRPNCSAMDSGGCHLFFPFFFPSESHLQAFSASLQLTDISQTEAYTPNLSISLEYTPVQSGFLQLPHKGTPLDHPALRVSRTWTCVPIAAL